MPRLPMAAQPQFLSTLSLRRATNEQHTQCIDVSYFYPRSPCGERLACCHAHGIGVCISIHALLAESDIAAPAAAPSAEISIHALLAESDHLTMYVQSSIIIFLSTLSLRRATHAHGERTARQCNFYPRSPCGERLYLNEAYGSLFVISIHALLAESDSKSAQNSGALLRI